jgi:hypothetical protein
MDRDIDNPVDKVSLQFGIAMSKNLIGDKTVVMGNSGHMGQELS